MADTQQWQSFDLYNPTEEHRMLRQMVREFVEGEVETQAAEYDRKENFNLDLFRRLGELGLLGITVSDKFGGSGMDPLAAVIAHEELSASDPGFCLAYLAHAMLCVNNVAANASDEQKQRWLPKLCSGEWVGAMAMSEPHVGTDVLGMKSTAVRSGDHYVLNGRKMWITNGTLDENRTACDAVLVYARTGEKNGKPQISTFLVEKSNAGFSVGQKIQDKLGMRASNTAELVFQDCKVPAANLIGKEGESMLHMMRNLEIERLTLAAMSLGIARRSVEIMTKYASEREAFGQPLSFFGQVQKMIGDSYAEYRAAKAYVYETARRMRLDSHGQRLDSDGVKLVASTAGKNIADRAIQVLGGYGYVGEYVVERLWRDAKLLEIGGGTLEAHQKNITRDLAKNGLAGL
ncbi:MAG: acyl-CoA dehydrogenase family protein [Bdellovibrionales bacterium]|nr:acyl-CoA dehydrogenase family protein [Bdellovibrionales bacterium]